MWIRWDTYRTLIVIERAGGRVLPAWVATYEAASGKLAVAYRAVASRGQDGVLTIDARGAMISGPQAWQWSPDSFTMSVEGMVTIRDEVPSHPSNHGEIEKIIDHSAEPAIYLRWLREAQSWVGEGV